MTMKRPDSDPTLSRRGFISAAVVSPVTAALWSPAQAAAVTTRQVGRSSWIPSARFLDRLPRYINVASMPAVSMAVLESGNVVWASACGPTDAATRQAVLASSTFEAASMSKPVFAYVVMRLVDEGIIGLDQPLVRYRRPDFLSDDPNLSLVTVRHALAYSSGLPNWRATPDERLRTTFQPGTAYRYSGDAFYWSSSSKQ